MTAPRYRGRILVIDDEPEIVDAITEYFGDAGYEVRGALSGGDGLMLAEIAPPSVVLLDLRMPGLSGIEVLERLQARWSRLPVIIVTGSHDIPTAKSLSRRGAFDVVRKPFLWDDLHRCVTEALGSSGRPAREAQGTPRRMRTVADSP